MPCAIHLFKDRSDDPEFGRPDPYEEHIDNVNFIPVMRFETIGFEDICSFLKSCPDFDGVIVTSQRAVDVLKSAFDQIPNCERIQKLPAYTVGPVTARRLELIGFQSVFGADTGNGRALANVMIPHLKDQNCEAQRFLFVAGEVHRDILPRELVAAGHTVDKLVVYRTSAYDYRDQLAKVQEGDWLVFFSPSHVNQALEEIKSRQMSVKIAAIGPTTYQYLLDNQVSVDAVAEQPTAVSLLDAINKVKK